MIGVRLAQTPEEVQHCLRVRWTVFVEEQGVRPGDEQDAHDQDDAVHALATLDGVPCGAGRLTFTAPSVAKIERMAVSEEVRQRGVGKALLAFLESEARRRGATRLTLSAQVRARAFYEKAGYAASGGEYDDGTGIAHVSMEKSA
ncbi:MAG: GNAT family N-acetyltransferase [Deltaproteobacteria bacterium]|nr:MAG: GNAT family N-acetyltransferase [Deltaproteobacteria bacterium]